MEFNIGKLSLKKKKDLLTMERSTLGAGELLSVEVSKQKQKVYVKLCGEWKTGGGA